MLLASTQMIVSAIALLLIAAASLAANANAAPTDTASDAAQTRQTRRRGEFL